MKLKIKCYMSFLSFFVLSCTNLQSPKNIKETKIIKGIITSYSSKDGSCIAQLKLKNKSSVIIKMDSLKLNKHNFVHISIGDKIVVEVSEVSASGYFIVDNIVGLDKSINQQNHF